MRKNILFICLIMSIVITCGCGILVREEKYDFLYDQSEISTIEIVCAEGKDDYLVYATIDDTELFMKELKQIDSLKAVLADPRGLMYGDMAIKIVYNSGEYEIVGESGQLKYLDEREHNPWRCYYMFEDGFEKLIVENLNVVERYDQFAKEKMAQEVALIYLNSDCVPELLILKEGEYSIYTIEGYEIKEIPFPENIRAMSNDSEQEQKKYQFEYEAGWGNVRVHDYDETGDHVYYLSYEDGVFVKHLESRKMNGTEYFYGEEGTITCEEFQSRISELGVDDVEPCEHMYADVESAYEKFIESDL